MKRASGILKNEDRLKSLLNSARGKISELNMDSFKKNKLGDRLKLILRMLKAYANGSYRIIPWTSLLVLVGALVYFVTPLDLIPDFVPVTGFVDDLSVVLWVFNRLKHDIADFEQWEQHRGTLQEQPIKSQS